MTASMPAPTTLDGTHVRLEPLTLDHVPDLFVAQNGDEETWRWLSFEPPKSEEDMRRVVSKVLAVHASGSAVPFAVISKESGRAVGTSSYLDVPTFDESIEIGGTWYGRSVWRSAVNTECKLLLLTHGFEDLGYERIVLKTHHRNERSQAAIARLGAVREGTLRHHLRHKDGEWRDTVVFSILADEWPDVKANLTARLARG